MIDLKTLWIDILTPKQARLLGSIASELSSMGYRTIVTARDYDYTIGTLQRMGIDFKTVGGYAYDLREKLVIEARRIIELLDYLEDFDAAIAFPNPVAARISFGLGKPFIAFTDSPHSVAPSRLTLPLARAVIASTCIPQHEIRKYIYRNETIVEQFRGVDEVQWLKDYEPDINAIRELELEPFNYIVVRPPEVRASYYTYRDTRGEIAKIVEAAMDMGLRVVYLPRYAQDPIVERFRDRKEFVVPSRSVGVEGPTLAFYATAVVTGGGTLAREAALMGTLGISLFPQQLYVNKCVEEFGFPLKQVESSEEALRLIRDAVRDPEKHKSRSRWLIYSLETPMSALLRVLRELGI